MWAMVGDEQYVGRRGLPGVVGVFVEGSLSVPFVYCIVEEVMVVEGAVEKGVMEGAGCGGDEVLQHNSKSP